ncbi:hypothetical protein FACS1894111_00150 [Clostridia bacterium]|nr:hypothetical protein FACS1894111_00150 [Clostridia bacterium]
MSDLRAVILAAGKGTRMQSDLPKVLHEIEGTPLADYVIDAARGAGVAEICVVVGYQAERVRESLHHKDVVYALQEEQLGTGHAVKCAADFLGNTGETLILFGDTPLITAKTLKELIAHHREKKNAVTVLTAVVEDPFGYGRIIRNETGEFVKSVEHKDAKEQELFVNEINSGMYVFDTAELKEALEQLRPDNAQGEYYLPDTIVSIKKKGLLVDAYQAKDPLDIVGVNDTEQLKAAAGVIRRRRS